MFTVIDYLALRMVFPHPEQEWNSFFLKEEEKTVLISATTPERWTWTVDTNFKKNSSITF